MASSATLACQETSVASRPPIGSRSARCHQSPIGSSASPRPREVGTSRPLYLRSSPSRWAFSRSSSTGTVRSSRLPAPTHSSARSSSSKIVRTIRGGRYPAAVSLTPSPTASNRTCIGRIIRSAVAWSMSISASADVASLRSCRSACVVRERSSRAASLFPTRRGTGGRSGRSSRRSSWAMAAGSKGTSPRSSGSIS